MEALSVGQKQRLALASIIAMEPSLLILDEPTANLDPYGTVSFFENLTVLKKTLSMTIFLIEHRIDMALPLVDRVIIMNRNGRIISSGDPGRIFGNDTGSLEAEGIWLPTPCRLAGELKRRGFPVSRNPLSLDDTEELFRSIFSLPKAGKSGSQDISPSTTLKESDLAVSIEDLSFAYTGGPKVLDGVCLQVERGAFLALVGENGSGKSTLAKSLSGLIRPKSGDIFIMGYSAKAIKSSCFVRYVGYVFQNPEHQFVTERVSDELSYSLKRHYAEEEVERRLEELLHNFDLKGYEDANPFSLSQGQKRRLSVATMIALNQPILILDEPTFGQDRGSTLSLMELVQSLHKRGKTIILITHDMQLVLEYAWSAAVMHQGKILFKGSPHSLFQNADILSTASLTLPFEAQLGNRLGDSELFTKRDWFDRLQCWLREKS
ncbi:putative HMP/thiamine import ATP-binding protein YkoD [subsurface metagenome]